MSERFSTLYAALSQAQKDQVEAAMKEYNGTSLDESFTDPELFFHKIFNPAKTRYHIVRRAA